MKSITTEIAIIGAGSSGCFIANLLHESGIDCTLIEKSRGLGGRCSRRRVDKNISVDLGAQEFSMTNIQNPILQDKLRSWIQSGFLSPWSKTTSHFKRSDKIEVIETLCASPSMNTWHKKISIGINTLTHCKVHTLKLVENHWHLLDEQGKCISVARKVIITSPAEQAFDLLKEFDGFSDCERAAHKSLPQYVCAIGFTKPINMAADSFQGGHTVLESATREHTKPGRDQSTQDIWLLHSTYEWARQQGSTSHQQAALALTESFCQNFKIHEPPTILTSHFWRLSRHESVLNKREPFIWNSDLKIGCCGDWLDNNEISGALNSALALFEKITHTSK